MHKKSQDAVSEKTTEVGLFSSKLVFVVVAINLWRHAITLLTILICCHNLAITRSAEIAVSGGDIFCLMAIITQTKNNQTFHPSITYALSVNRPVMKRSDALR